MKLLVGLGNPGKEYQMTRHNMGFLAVQKLQEKLGLPSFTLKPKFKAAISEGILNNEKVILALPQTFMNLSGDAVTNLVNFYKCPLQNLWVVYDDIDLSFETLRIKPSGSAGTHNGMRSVVSVLGTDQFPRLRIGIARKASDRGVQQDISSFVLASFSPDETKKLPKILDTAAQALLTALTEGVEKAMEKYN